MLQQVLPGSKAPTICQPDKHQPAKVTRPSLALQEPRERELKQKSGERITIQGDLSLSPLARTWELTQNGELTPRKVMLTTPQVARTNR